MYEQHFSVVHISMIDEATLPARLACRRQLNRATCFILHNECLMETVSRSRPTKDEQIEQYFAFQSRPFTSFDLGRLLRHTQTNYYNSGCFAATILPVALSHLDLTFASQYTKTTLSCASGRRLSCASGHRFASACTFHVYVGEFTCTAWIGRQSTRIFYRTSQVTSCCTGSSV